MLLLFCSDALFKLLANLEEGFVGWGNDCRVCGVITVNHITLEQTYHAQTILRFSEAPGGGKRSWEGVLRTECCCIEEGSARVGRTSLPSRLKLLCC